MKKKTYLPVSRGELRAIVITSLIICMSVILPPHLAQVIQPVLPPHIEITQLGSENFIADIALSDNSLSHESGSDNQRQGGNSNSESIGRSKTKTSYGTRSQSTLVRRSPLRCRKFDPNAIHGDTLIAWGIQSYIVRNMLKYRSSGGKFRKPEDFQRVYGMDSLTYKQLVNCIDIKKEVVRPVFVNNADTSEWMSLPGIGPVLSKRIIKFRDMLGGFHTIDQVADTYGLPIETFASIRSSLRIHRVPKTINLTTATEAQLSAHPYISQKQARVMINYFKQHGRPQSLSDLGNLYIADSVWLSKVIPYFKINNTVVN